MPALFENKHKAECQGCRFTRTVEQKYQELQGNFKYLKAKLFLDPSLEFNMNSKDYIRVRSLIETRYFNYPFVQNGEIKFELGLNPFNIDMI